jgi:hypothetical protein
MKPDLVLGDPFKPSMTSKTFCKPTSVVQLENGDFFVADGYCNARIIKFNFKGEKILEVIVLSMFSNCTNNNKQFLYFSGEEIHSLEKI